jgi:hypothetical protein
VRTQPFTVTGASCGALPAKIPRTLNPLSSIERELSWSSVKSQLSGGNPDQAILAVRKGAWRDYGADEGRGALHPFELSTPHLLQPRTIGTVFRGATAGELLSRIGAGHVHSSKCSVIASGINRVRKEYMCPSPLSLGEGNTTRFHQSCCLAARGARPAASDAGDRFPQQPLAQRIGEVSRGLPICRPYASRNLKYLRGLSVVKAHSRPVGAPLASCATRTRCESEEQRKTGGRQ